MSTAKAIGSLPGFTLVEVLLALALMAIALSAGMRLVRQNLVVEQSLREIDARQLPEDAAFDVLERDLDGTSHHQGAIRMPEGLLLDLTTLARFSDAAARQSLLLPAKARYRLERHDNAVWLVRELKNLTVKNPAVERLVLLRDVDHVTLRVHDGREWLPATDTVLQEIPVALEAGITRMGGSESCRIHLFRDTANIENGRRRAQR